MHLFINLTMFRKLLTVAFLIFTGSCKNSGSFLSANHLYNEEVILYLTNNTTIKGFVNIDLEKFNSTNIYYTSQIEIRLPGGEKTTKIGLDSISGYSHQSAYYALK